MYVHWHGNDGRGPYTDNGSMHTDYNDTDANANTRSYSSNMRNRVCANDRQLH